MWLINTKTLRLEEFQDYSAVEYAILSHTWGDDEVSFKDMQDFARAKRQAGFVKIATTCELALKEGLEYAWVDTCCIDKTSSAELSEAINAMFVWYQASAVCFVWLEDLAPLSSISKATSHGRKLRNISKMSSCKWFSRGWTLQELLAPANVRFYDANWNFRFTKENNVSTLSTITKIEVEVLKMAKRLKDVLVAVKMSWAANRETTRPEDVAYCLLGIFDINMPMLYGEGEKAFQRLQEQIGNQQQDASMFACEALEAFVSKPIKIRLKIGRAGQTAYPGAVWDFKTYSFCGDALPEDFFGLFWLAPEALKPLHLTLGIKKMVGEEIGLRFYYADPASSRWGIVGGSRKEDILNEDVIMVGNDLSRQCKAGVSSHLYSQKASVWYEDRGAPEGEVNNAKVKAIVNGLEIAISMSMWSNGAREIEMASIYERNKGTVSHNDSSSREKQSPSSEPDDERKPRRFKRLKVKK
ncbi:Vegetative incompatibility protein HET-E-1 [Colletotrichum siamense]|nr:Vegetative incompatibility protein HET-E-1 [Colletotrichum siamense]